MANTRGTEELHEREARKRRDNLQSTIARSLYQAITNTHDAGWSIDQAVDYFIDLSATSTPSSQMTRTRRIRLASQSATTLAGIGKTSSG